MRDAGSRRARPIVDLVGGVSVGGITGIPLKEKSGEDKMLFDMMSNQLMTKIPYEHDFKAYRARITDQEYEAIMDRLNGLVDADISKGTDIQTSSWMPGRDWSGTPFDPIYQKAARKDHTASAKFFGLLVWIMFMNRPEKWTSGRFELDGKPLSGRTYFRIDVPRKTAAPA
jgi:hypothetical protein